MTLAKSGRMCRNLPVVGMMEVPGASAHFMWLTHGVQMGEGSGDKTMPVMWILM